jgi:hypothetical protein
MIVVRPDGRQGPEVGVTVLVVDAANVVGSRPDGWWRDRAGANERLLRRLAALRGMSLTGPEGPIECTGVVAVVEGRARGLPAPEGVDVVRATGSGDDALAQFVTGRAADPLLVVTADRGLRDRLPDGTAVTGPGWLLGVLDQIGCARPA